MIKKICIVRVASLSFGILTAFNVCAQNVEISIDEAMAIFYQRNLDLIAAQYNIDLSHAQQLIAGAIPNPSVGVLIQEIANKPNQGSSAKGCNPNPAVSCGVAEYYSFSQLIEVAGKRGLRMQSSGFSTQAAESDFRDAIRVFSNMLRDGYFQLLQAQKNYWLVQQIVDHYHVITEANGLRFKKGDISESDFLRVKMESLRAQSDLDAAQSEVEQAQAGLAMLLRWPDNSMKFEAKEQWPTISDIGQNLSKEQLITRALEQRPDLQADKYRVSQAEKELELARRLKYPDVTVNGGYAHDPSNNNLNTFFVGINVPVPLFYQYQGEADKATVNFNQSKVTAEQTEINIRSEVVSALANWNSADKIVQRFQSGLLDDALTIRNSAELAYSKGATNVLDFLEAQRGYKNVMHEYYQAMINRSNAFFDLGKSLGIDGNIQTNTNNETLHVDGDTK
jgi:cobalt-zinc-cadmium efflux system outer membrane protein